jgi:hypothetical protein
MKTYSSAISTYRGALKEFGQVDLLSFRVRSRNSPSEYVWFNFSSRDDDETIFVTDVATGDSEPRDFFGGGHIVALDPLVRSEGTVVRNFTFVLSGTSVPVQDMIQGYDCRDAVIEYRIGETDEDTGLLVDGAVVEFEGFVDTIDREDAAISIEGDQPADTNFKVSVVSHIAALQRPNTDMRSPEIGQERSDDDIFLYTSEANTWTILWGKEGKKGGGKDSGDKDGRDPRSPNPDPFNPHSR